MVVEPTLNVHPANSPGGLSAAQEVLFPLNVQANLLPCSFHSLGPVPPAGTTESEADASLTPEILEG